jgi:hypothetical protein
LNPRLLRRIHLYLGTIFAPLLLLFALSGSWQIYRWNDAKKDGSYKPSPFVRTLSSIHRDSTVAKGVPASEGFKLFAGIACLALITTTILGIVMAYRYTGSPVTVTLCLLAGTGIPLVLLVLRS